MHKVLVFNGSVDWFYMGVFVDKLTHTNMNPGFVQGLGIQVTHILPTTVRVMNELMPIIAYWPLFESHFQSFYVILSSDVFSH